jgi:23S rRNA (cytosine1962-C5)-methyltransferase
MAELNHTARIIVKPAAEKSIQRKHPWLFSGAIEKIKGEPGFGETVLVQSFNGNSLCYGAYSPKSQIRVRIWTFDIDETIDRLFFEKRIETAIRARENMSGNDTNAVRLINAENDLLPGLIVDRYNRYLVCQFLSAGTEFWKDTIVSILVSKLDVDGVYERSDTESREKEGMEKSTGLLYGAPPPETVLVKEYGVSFHVDIKNGHKTGFYIDQRENRRKLSTYSKNKKILNCFSYTGGFSTWALKGGASMVTNIDVSENALSLLKMNASLNGCEDTRFKTMNADVFQSLRTMRDKNEKFDLIILDPPKFAHTSHQVNKAARGYKDINLLALKLLSPGGYLFTFSCSGHIPSDLFQKIVADAAVDAKRDAVVLEYLHQPSDHPVALNFPEGLYLKGLICRVL